MLVHHDAISVKFEGRCDLKWGLCGLYVASVWRNNVCVCWCTKVDMRYRSITNTTYTINIQLVAYYVATVSINIWTNTELIVKTSASAGLKDANPTIRLTRRRRPPIPTAHPVWWSAAAIHPRSNAAAVTPREPKFTKIGEDLYGYWIVVEHSCKISHPYLFQPLRNP